MQTLFKQIDSLHKKIKIQQLDDYTLKQIKEYYRISLIYSLLMAMDA